MPRKKPSFYAKVLDEAERVELRAAANLDGLDEEIALIRVRIKRLVRTDDHDALVKLLNSLSRLLTARYNISKKDKKSIMAAIGNVLREVAVPLGISAGEKFLLK